MFPVRVWRKLLTEWETTARALGAARRLRLPSETRLDLRLANFERRIILFLYKETFGHVIGKPKLPRPYISKR